jgi:hypothetical protein
MQCDCLGVLGRLSYGVGVASCTHEGMGGGLATQVCDTEEA